MIYNEEICNEKNCKYLHKCITVKCLYENNAKYFRNKEDEISLKIKLFDFNNNRIKTYFDWFTTCFLAKNNFIWSSDKNIWHSFEVEE